MLDLLEHPKSEADKIPNTEERGSDKLPDIGREIKVCLEGPDDSQVDKITQSHKEHEADDLATRLALTGLVVKHPLLVDDEKEEMGKHARRRQSWNVRQVQQLVQHKEANICPPKENITAQLQLDEVNDEP